jgi:hypothetical protein
MIHFFFSYLKYFDINSWFLTPTLSHLMVYSFKWEAWELTGELEGMWRPSSAWTYRQSAREFLKWNTKSWPKAVSCYLVSLKRNIIGYRTVNICVIIFLRGTDPNYFKSRCYFSKVPLREFGSMYHKVWEADMCHSVWTRSWLHSVSFELMYLVDRAEMASTPTLFVPWSWNVSSRAAFKMKRTSLDRFEGSYNTWS